jgi:hypothetical protein
MNIGEIIEYRGTKLIVAEGRKCGECFFKSKLYNCIKDIKSGSCFSILRKDNTNIYFKEVKQNIR